MHRRNAAPLFPHCLLILCFVRDGVLSARIQLPQSAADGKLAKTVHNLAVSNDHLVSEMQRQAEVDATLTSSVDEIRKEVKRQKKQDVTLEKRIDKIPTDNERLWGNISRQEETDQTLQSNIDNVREELGEHEAVISKLTSRYNKIFASLPYKCRQTPRLKADIKKFKLENKELEDLENQLTRESYQRKSDKLDARIKRAKLDEQFTKLSAQIRNGEERLQLCPKLEPRPSNCFDLFQANDTESGVRTVDVGATPIDVYCEQDAEYGNRTDGYREGWTMIQRRFNGSVDFYRPWSDYVEGFGDLDGEFWLGLYNIHRLTKSKTVTLRIDLEDLEPVDENSSWPLTVFYDNFYIDGEAEDYRLHLGRFYTSEPTIGGSLLETHNGMFFSTYDNDHDVSGYYNCARKHQGGWWYRDCYGSNLNGRYYSDGRRHDDGIVWSSYQTGRRSFKRVEMKIRPKTD